MRSSTSTSGERDREPTLEGTATLEATATLGVSSPMATAAEAAPGTGRDRVEPTLVSSNAGPASMPGDGIGQARARLMAELLSQGLTVRLVVTGHSMSPFIRSGDRLEIEPLASAVRFGDVVAVATEGRLLIHRVVSFRGHPLRIRGDVAPHDDPPIGPAGILGRVALVMHGERRVRFGLGVERVAVAWASRMGVLRVLARLRERRRLGSRRP